MSYITSRLNDRCFVWALLTLPVNTKALGLTSGDPKAVHRLLHPTCKFAGRLMIIAIMIAPLTILFKKTRWLNKRRPLPDQRGRQLLPIRSFIPAAGVLRPLHPIGNQ